MTNAPSLATLLHRPENVAAVTDLTARRDMLLAAVGMGTCSNVPAGMETGSAPIFEAVRLINLQIATIVHCDLVDKKICR